MKTGAVDMTKWEMMQEVAECKNGQLFFQQLATLRPYALKEFDRA